MHDSWFTMMPHADDNVNDDGADVYDINDADAELYFEMGRIVTIRSSSICIFYSGLCAFGNDIKYFCHSCPGQLTVFFILNLCWLCLSGFLHFARSFRAQTSSPDN